MRRLLIAFIVLLLAPATAHAGGRGQTDSDGNIGAEADTPGESAASAPPIGGLTSGSGQGPAPKPKCTDTKAALECARLDPVTQPVEAEPADVDVPALARRAADSARLPAPVIRLSPERPHPAVVGLKTWLWLEGGAWNEVRAAAKAGDAKVTTTATPVSVTWDTGEGRIVCGGPGRPWRAGLTKSADTDCGYTFRRAASRQTVKVSVAYSVAWKCTGDDCDEDADGDLGVLASPLATADIRVVERQAVVVR